MTEPSTWLDADDVQTFLGAASAGASVDTSAMQAACDGVRSYVEGRRTDLFVPGDDGTPVYAPTGSVRLGAAMLANRFYGRRNTALGVLGFSDDSAQGILTNDPDIARLLGIGRQGRLVFGAAGQRTTTYDGGAPVPGSTDVAVLDGGAP